MKTTPLPTGLYIWFDTGTGSVSGDFVYMIKVNKDDNVTGIPNLLGEA